MTNEEMDAQFEEIIQQALQTMSDGVITIVKQQNRVIMVNLQEQRVSVTNESKNRHLSLVED
jgi:hypothetical protein